MKKTIIFFRIKAKQIEGVIKMKIYLMRHGEAEKNPGSIESMLTDKGIAQVSEMAERLKEKKINVDEVYHSGLLRAEESASIVKSTAFNYLEDTERSGDLAPQAEPKRWQSKLEEEDYKSMDILFVSHIPFLDKFTETLINDISDIQYACGTIVCLEKNEGQDWKVLWQWDP